MKKIHCAALIGIIFASTAQAQSWPTSYDGLDSRRPHGAAPCLYRNSQVIAGLSWFGALTSRTSETVAWTTDPKAISLKPPKFPLYLESEGVSEGAVLARLTLSAKGKPTDVTVVCSSDERLEPAAVKALKRAKFTPALRDGVAVESAVNIPILFRSTRDYIY